MPTALSSPAFLLCLGVLLGMVSLAWLALFRDREEKNGPVSLDLLGFRSGEDVHTFAVGQVLFADEHLIGGGGTPDNPSYVKTTLTTADRLLVDVNGQLTWFESDARPRLRPVGRIMMKDTTGFFGMLTGASETVVSFVPDGTRSPDGMVPKRLDIGGGAVEDVYVLELSVPGRQPLRFEAVRPAAMTLCQWSRGSASVGAISTPSHVLASMPLLTTDSTLRSLARDRAA